MAVEATNIAQFAVAAVYLALAVWLLYLNFPNKINRSLALLFFLRGFVLVLNQFATIDSSNFAYWHNIRTYVFIATAFSILDFLIVYTWRKSSPSRRGVRRFLFGALLAVEIANALDHSLFFGIVNGIPTFGPAGFMVTLFAPLLAVAALWFHRMALRTPVQVQARFHRLLALGFATAAIAEAGGPFFTFLSLGWTVFSDRAAGDAGVLTARLVTMSAVPIALVATGVLVAESFWNGARDRAAWQLSVVGIVVILPLITILLPIVGARHSLILFSALPRAFAPILISYALVRQVTSGLDVFALDLRTSFIIKSGTVGGILIAFFFVVSESTASLFGEFAATQNLSPQVAQIVGIVGAGVLLVFLHPLNRLGDRLSGNVLPHGKPLGMLETQERLRIYREQVELAWADGSITRKERLLLDKLREQLNLPLGETARLESKAARRSASGQ